MSKHHRIETISDLLALSDDEFERVLPEFIAYRELLKVAENVGACGTGIFTWVDDGRTGEVFSIRVTTPDGETTVIPGPAFEDAK